MATLKLAAALQAGEALPAVNQTSHAFLATRWGDQSSDLRRLATWLYETKDNLDLHAGQSVIAITKGSQFNLRTSKAILPSELHFTSGVLKVFDYQDEPMGPFRDVTQLIYGPVYKPAGQPRVNQVARLIMLIACDVADQSRHIIGKSGNYLPGTTPRDSAAMPFYTSSTPIGVDRQIYLEQASSQASELLVGNGPCFDFLKRLVGFVGGAPARRFEELWASGSIQPDQPLPDIGQLLA